MGTHEAQMKGVLPWLARWACRADTRYFCPALAALVSPVPNIFFLTATQFHFIWSHRPATWAIGHAVLPGCLSLNM
jgi:hypothetical protein